MSDLYKSFQTLVHELKTVARSVTLQTLLLQGHLNQYSNLPTCNLRS